jgi:hypothetical protein
VIQTVNKLVGKIAARAAELANMKINRLRLEAPAYEESVAAHLRIAKLDFPDRGRLIEAILLEEFSEEFDRSIDP